MTQSPRPGVLLAYLGLAPETADEFNRWHRTEHVPERLSVPGFVSGRRYREHTADSAFLVYYMTVDSEVFRSAPYVARLDDPTPWTSAVVATFRFERRQAFDVSYARGGGVGRHLVWADLTDTSGLAALVDELAALASATTVRVCEPNDEVTAARDGTREAQQYAGPRACRYGTAILVETEEAGDAETAAALLRPNAGEVRLFELMSAYGALGAPSS